MRILTPPPRCGPRQGVDFSVTCTPERSPPAPPSVSARKLRSIEGMLCRRSDPALIPHNRPWPT